MTDKNTRKPKQQRGIEKRNQIKQTALQLFSQKGYHKTTSNEIAKEAGIAIGTFYSYFADKKNLYEELVLDMYKKILDDFPEMSITDSPTPYNYVRSYIQVLLESHNYMPAFQHEAAVVAEQYEEFYQLEKNFRSRITSKLMTVLLEHPVLLRVTDYKLAGVMVQTCVEAFIHETRFHANSFDSTHVINNLADMICQYLFKPEYL